MRWLKRIYRWWWPDGFVGDWWKEKWRPLHCPHHVQEQDKAMMRGLCPLCLSASLDNWLRAVIWMRDQDPQLVDAACEKFGLNL